jgi:hypothetical protein
MEARRDELLSWQVMAKLSSVSRVMILAVRHQTRVTSHPVRKRIRSKLWDPGMEHNAAAALHLAVEPVQQGGFESLAPVEGVQRPDLGHVRPDCLDRAVKAEGVGDHGTHPAGGHHARDALRGGQARRQRLLDE